MPFTDTKKRRGRQTELHIEKMLRTIASLKGYLYIRLEVKTICTAAKPVFLEKQPCDYLLLTAETAWLLDAKECTGKIWYPKKAPLHQRRAFAVANALGYRAGFLVNFTRMQKYVFHEDMEKACHIEDRPFDFNLL